MHVVWDSLGAVLGLGALCGLWVLFQHWIARVDPGMRGIEDGCDTCQDATCDRRETGSTHPAPRHSG